MGCGNIGNRNIHQDYILLLKERLIQCNNQSENLSGCGVIQTLTKIHFEKMQFLSMNMEGIPTSESDINQILNSLVDTYSNIKLSITIFFEICHSECIKDFKLTDGILLMLISMASSNEGILRLSTSLNAPYFLSFQIIKQLETKEIYSA